MFDLPWLIVTALTFSYFIAAFKGTPGGLQFIDFKIFMDLVGSVKYST